MKNVELVERIYRRIADEGLAVVDERDGPFGDSRFEFVASPELPDAGTYRGEGARRFITDWGATFDSLVLETGEYLHAGDKVAVRTRLRGRPRGTRTEVVGDWWVIFTLDDDKIMRLQFHPRRSYALETLGLAD